MFSIQGEVTDVGSGVDSDGLMIKIDDPKVEGVRTVTITGLTRDELRAAARMLFHQVKLRIDSREDIQTARDDQPAIKRGSNIDEATGIRKTGEI